MSESAGKCRKRYVDNPKDWSRLTCLIHGPVYSPAECKVLVDFGYKCSKRIPIKYHVKELENKKRLRQQKENNAVFQNADDYMILQYNKKLSVEYESYKNINYEVDKKIYMRLIIWVLMKINIDVSMHLKDTPKVYMILKDRMALFHIQKKQIKYLNAIYSMIY